ncbi:IPT/TIG domain-containing protein [Paenibacillus sp. E194]|uniref:IPT/TIG domain-containing protein n=1 Tax=Paenibacillus sp. E194 TaxID=1458845 RepID=UPI0018CCE7A7|nr:IPT/TIG domain-containing protein [Paenibacillus sp. E194]
MTDALNRIKKIYQVITSSQNYKLYFDNEDELDGLFAILASNTENDYSNQEKMLLRELYDLNGQVEKILSAKKNQSEMFQRKSQSLYDSPAIQESYFFDKKSNQGGSTLKRVNRIAVLMLTFLITISGINIPYASAATDYVTATKLVNPASILVGEETEVTLNIEGTPPVNVVKPNDVILVIDRSGSMGTDKMRDAKESAKGFIDLMDFTKHRVGIVDYSSDIKNFDLTTDKAAAKSYIDKITANGGTATADAIGKAQELLANHRPDAQPVIVLLTDGAATVGGDGLSAFDYALKKALEAKDAGIVFYTIALLNAGENPESSEPNKLMKNMATTARHHHFVLGSVGLNEIYGAIVKEIGLTSAYDVTVTDEVSDQFEIVPNSYDHNIPKPVVTGNTLTWKFLELKKDTLTFTYKVRHKSDGKNGNIPVSTTKSMITYKDYTGVERSYRTPSASVEVKYPAPVITSVTPDKGNVTGGESVTIKGANFRPNPTVTFGSAYAKNVTYVNDKEITVETPAGSQGKVSVKVTNDDNQFALTDFNYYANPEITSITPSNGPMGGGTTIKVYGKYFLKGVKVKFGENYSPNVSYNNDVSLSVDLPATDKPGPVDVVIENPDGTTVTSKGGFTYNEPPKMELISVSPTEGITTGGETVALIGKEFQKGAEVFFNDVKIPTVSFISTEKLSIKTPVWADAATVDVKVVNPDGKPAALTQAFKYVTPPPPPAPTIKSISPNSGRMDVSTMIYIDGTDFVKGAKVVFGGSDELSADFIDSTRMRIRTPLWDKAETVDINVINPDGQKSESGKEFTFLPIPEKQPPAIKSVIPSNGPMAGGTMIYVDGAEFQKGAKLYLIKGATEVELEPEFINATRLRLRTPATTESGPVDIKVVNPDNKSVVFQTGFTYDAPPVFPDPVITSVSPNSGNKKGGNIIDIMGTDFQKGATVTIDTTTVSLYAYIDSTRVRVKVPAANPGSVDVTLTNPDGKSSKMANGYTYEESKPEITSITPNKGPFNGGTLVYVDGIYLEPSIVVTFNGNVIDYEFINSTRIRFRTPPAQKPGPVDIVLTHPSGASVTAQFTYDEPPVIPAPKISVLLPASGSVNGGTMVYVDGANYQKGATVTFNGVSYTAEFINSTRVRLRSPQAAAPGIVEVKVINPDGKESNGMNFEYK